MATITIPFPSTETLLGPERARAASPPKITIKSPTKKQPGYKKHSIQSKALNGVAKPKQTKSRNGCHTCKEKRLKCDETKPKCDQCKRRNVPCGGYNKIFQWRPEEKATFRAGPSPKSRKRPTTIQNCASSPTSPDVPNRSELATTISNQRSIFFQPHTFLLERPPVDQQEVVDADCTLKIGTASTSPGARVAPRPWGEAELFSCALMGDKEEADAKDDFEPVTARTGYPYGSSPALDGASLYTGNFDIACTWHRPLIFPYPDHEMLDSFVKRVGDGEEQVVSQDRILSPTWSVAYPSPSPSASSSSSSSTVNLAITEPVFNPFSTEMLITRFASETCGILSIKDGHSENPWRTMLLPMSFGVPALHHAILCLSAFHASREDKRFRITGLKQMQKSIRYLSSQLRTMRRDAALATTLVLAFSESWNEETSTGIQHLKGARALVTQAIANHEANADFAEMERLKFLRNTWVYMDVIARITALDDDDLENLDTLFAPVYGPEGQVEELDPLMGCAWELFPLLGKVANLVREIRRTTGNSPRMVSKAAALKVEILRWRAPTELRVPQDESIEVAHTLSTAEAYRWSALLFLYQAVPMIATQSPSVLAERILFHLVSVPLTSRVIIIQIFPLLVAGCEVAHEDNRLLVKERWASMTQRMTIGNLDRCSDVVHEVWTRRDEIARLIQDEEKQTSMQDEIADELPFPTGSGIVFSPPTPCPNIVRPDQLHRRFSEPVFDIADSITVRGYGHWLTVMEDWEWAVLLG